MNNHPPICPHCGNVDIGALVADIRSVQPTVFKGQLTAKEAGDYIGFSERYVRDLIRNGELTAIHSGRTVRLPVAELDRWITEKVREEERSRWPKNVAARAAGKMAREAPISGKTARGR